MVEFTSIKLGLTNCFLLKSKTGYVLVDTGPPGRASEFWNFLDDKKISPSEIVLIVVTHAHYDHVGNLAEIKEKTGAKVLIHKNEIDALGKGMTESPSKATSWGRILVPFLKFVETEFTPVEPDIVIENDTPLNNYGIDGKIIHTPGHTSGSISILLESGDAFIGDLAMSSFPLRLSPGVPVFWENLDEIYNSWKRLVYEGAKILYPSHGKPFPIAVLKQKLSSL